MELGAGSSTLLSAEVLFIDRTQLSRDALGFDTYTFEICTKSCPEKFGKKMHLDTAVFILRYRVYGLRFKV